MRCLFLYPNLQRAATPQLGIAVLSAVLKEAGHETALCDLTFVSREEMDDVFTRAVAEFEPQLIAASVRSSEWRVARELLHQAPNIPHVVGGPHPTVAAEDIVGDVDMLVRGEGEETLLDIVRALEAGTPLVGIPNVWMRENGVTYRNPLRPLIQDLDAWPHPDWDIWEPQHFSEHFLRELRPGTRLVGTFEGSRGCPYTCTYCSSPTVMGMYKGKGRWRREKSPERMVEEITAFRERYPIDFVYWVDEVFLTRLERVKAFRDAYKPRLSIPFAFMERPELITEEKARYIADAGAYSVSIGLETGDEELRRELLQRRTPQEQVIRAFHIAREVGMKTHSFTMVGLPGQDEASMMKTFDVLAHIQPDTVQFTIFYPLRGTVLYEQCAESGYMDPEMEMPLDYYAQSVLTLPNVTADVIRRYQVLFTMFAGRNEPWVRRLIQLAGRHAWAFAFLNAYRWGRAAVRTYRRHGLAYTFARAVARLRGSRPGIADPGPA